MSFLYETHYEVLCEAHLPFTQETPSGHGRLVLHVRLAVGRTHDPLTQERWARQAGSHEEEEATTGFPLPEESVSSLFVA